MRIFVGTSPGKKVELQVELSDTIFSIISKIKEKEGIPEDQQRLIWGGKQLREDGVVWEYNIQRTYCFTLFYDYVPPASVTLSLYFCRVLTWCPRLQERSNPTTRLNRN